jgi:uncharacterized oxidoreductase
MTDLDSNLFFARAEGIDGCPDIAKLLADTAGAISGLEKDKLEIRPGQSNVLKIMSRLAPQFILNQLSKSVDAMLKP